LDQAYIDLIAAFRADSPSLPVNDWSIHPDLGALLIAMFQERRPQTVIELGSGFSTILMGHCLRSLGSGMRLITLEHNPQYYEATLQALQQHGLEDTVSLRLAPLQSYPFGKRMLLWYDVKLLEDIEAIDFLLVDGPPGDIQPGSRYPAMPLLYDKLASKVTVIMDDYHRQTERDIVRFWLQQFPGFQSREHPLTKGCVELYR
jgi:predicted O-methyltransferase YrrM